MKNLVYKTVEADSIPEPVDCTSSPTTVYLNRNVHEVEKQDEEGTHTVFRYEQAQITKDEYIAVLREQQEITDEALQELILMMEV